MEVDFFQPEPTWEGLDRDSDLLTEEPSAEAADDGRVDDEEDTEVTYVFLPKEEPGFDQMYEQAGDFLEAPGGMLDLLKIFPVNINKERVMYLARFEMGQDGQDFQFPKSILKKPQELGTVAGWIDFMTAFPVACIELQAIVGEVSSRPDLKNNLVETVASSGGVTPDMPKTLFGGYTDSKIPLNLLYLTNDYSEFMAADTEGEPKPTGLHWWLRTNLMGKVNGADPPKWPYPGEFLALAVRLMPDRYWDSQESNPFLYAGNFVDTVYFTSGIIKEVHEPTDDRPYPTYRVTWRKSDDNPDGEYDNVMPTDFTEFKVGDRVTILKDVETDKKTQLWRDPDMSQLDTGKIAIAPLSFYGIDVDQQQEA